MKKALQMDTLFLITSRSEVALPQLFHSKVDAKTFRDKNWDRRAQREEEIQIENLAEWLGL